MTPQRTRVGGGHVTRALPFPLAGPARRYGDEEGSLKARPAQGCRARSVNGRGGGTAACEARAHGEPRHRQPAPGGTGDGPQSTRLF